MKIISIDPGTYYTGYAIFNESHRYLDNKGLIDYGVIYSKNNSLQERLHHLRGELIELTGKYDLDVLVMENYFFHTQTTQGKYILYAQGVILEALHNKQILVEYLTPSEVKKFITGNGLSKKNIIKQQVEIIFEKTIDKSKFPDITKLDDIYDAIAIGHTFVNVKANKIKNTKEL